MSPKVSILLATYNQRDFVRQSIESALQQTCRDIEIIAYDNGSSDGTADILKSYAALDDRVKLVLYGDNGSQTKRSNEALSHCRGEFISILCGDDFYLPTKIERQLECFSGLPDDYGVVYSPIYGFNDITGERWLDPCLEESGSILKELLLQHHSAGPISIISPLIRKECVLRYPYREEFSVEGESIFFRMAMGYKFKFLGEPLAVMRNHLSNAGKAITTTRDHVLPLFEKLAQEPELPAECLRALNVFRGRLCRNYGWQGVRVVEDPNWARQCFAWGLRYHPWQIFHPWTAAGFGLSLLPKTALRSVNSALNRLLHHKENVVFKKDYR